MRLHLFTFICVFHLSRYVLPVTRGSAHSSKSAKRHKRDDQASLVHACRVLIHKVRRPIIYGERWVCSGKAHSQLMTMMMMIMMMMVMMVIAVTVHGGEDGHNDDDNGDNGGNENDDGD